MEKAKKKGKKPGRLGRLVKKPGKKPAGRVKQPAKPAEKIKLDRHLAARGGVSRRRAARLISEGHALINGRRADSPRALIDPRRDKIQLMGREVKAGPAAPIYLMLNKPEKSLTSTTDHKGRRTVMDFIGRQKSRVFPVGRLDWDSEGLLLLTSDGEFAQKILHPRHQTAKTYLAQIQGKTSPSQRARLLKGVSLPGGRGRALYIKPLPRSGASREWLKIIIAEGKNRQIRMMLQKIGFRVSRLRRTAIGRLKLRKLRKGACIRLKKEEAEKALLRPKELSRQERPQWPSRQTGSLTSGPKPV